MQLYFIIRCKTMICKVISAHALLATFFFLNYRLTHLFWQDKLRAALTYEWGVQCLSGCACKPSYSQSHTHQCFLYGSLDGYIALYVFFFKLCSAVFHPSISRKDWMCCFSCFGATTREGTSNKMDSQNLIFSLPTHRSLSDGTIVATRLTLCPCPVTLLWVALSIYFHFIKLTQLRVSANTTSVMAAHWAPALELLTKHWLISALAQCAHPVCPLSLLRTRPAHQSSLVL